MILYNWMKCVDGHYQYSRIEVKNDIINKNDIKAWELIYDSYINTFGINKYYQEYLKICIKIAKNQTKYIETNNKLLLTNISIFEFELQELKKNMKSDVSTFSILNALSKMQGYHINTKEITVTEYFSLIKDYERAN